MLKRMQRTLAGAGVALVACVALSWNAAADTQTGSLGAGAQATDYYRVTCSDDGAGTPASIVFQIRDETPGTPALLSVQIHRNGQLSNTTDLNDLDNVYSLEVSVNGGPGVYDLLVNKTAPGAENYTVLYHCTTGLDGGGLHTGASISLRQNQ